MSFAILYFSNQEGGIDKQITYTEFKDMINKGYANKIIAYDDNTVEMYIKPEFVKDVFKNDYKKVGRNPALNVEIGSTADSHCIRATHSGILTSIHSTAAYATVSPRIQRSPTQCITTLPCLLYTSRCV